MTEVEQNKKTIEIIRQINILGQQIIDNYQYPRQISLILKKFYQYIKYQRFLFGQSEFPSILSNQIIIFERKIPYYPLINSNINLNTITSQIKWNYSSEEILDVIVKEARLNTLKRFPNKNINQLNLANECALVSQDIINIANKYNLEAGYTCIEAGFDREAKIYDGNCFHYFSIVKVNNKNYLVDCTYSQFFNLKYNIIDRLGMLNTYNCQPGIFMLMEEERKKLAITLLNRGWIPLTPKNLKIYLDGFAISYRNGLYYETFGEKSYFTNYTADDYKEFLLTPASQVKKEGIEVLGPQRKLLKNPNLKF